MQSLLGFTHISSGTRDWKGFTVKRKTTAKRLRAKLQAAAKQHLRRQMHAGTGVVTQWLRRVVQGSMNYHAIPGNLASFTSFRTQIIRQWFRCLHRRGDRHSYRDLAMRFSR
jgi:hypothetical protein